MGKIVIIAAIGKNNALGKDNDLIWHLPDDFKRFKQLTTGHKIIMGRKTFESFPKPLPNRTHIIITRDHNYSLDLPSCTVVHSMDEALNLVQGDPLSYIIGGGEIYDLGMPHADVLEITKVHESFDADTYFPEIDKKIWKLIKEEFHSSDERHNYNFTYLTYQKRNI